MIFGVADHWARVFECVIKEPLLWYEGGVNSSFTPVTLAGVP